MDRETVEAQKILFAAVQKGIEAAARLREDPPGADAETLRRVVVDGLSARDTLFKFHSRLIWMLVRRREKRMTGQTRLSSDDLFQEGSFGLIRAIEKFDPDRRVPFSVYAYAWILQSMIQAHLKDGIIRIPCYVHHRYIEKEKEGTGSRSELPSADTLLDITVNTDSGEASRLVDLLRDEESDYQQVIRSDVSILLSKMDPLGAYYYRKHYLDGMSLEELARDAGCTRQTLKNNMDKYAREVVHGSARRRGASRR